ncbi:hypothetical protein [Sulfitobacter sp. HI0023]|uniref:hypothetical protein n=2 Tax=unclassified Sulfitobacter TaxID=196795 RepID=UPI0007C22FCC|nr:hypothetical protein [Sulfitobacter sp. HI0023]KZX94662.1 hypothetical protein A3721_09560 [Sulfitobacter sp. HI0023]
MGVIDTAISVLMVGHSLFGPTGPEMLQDALRAGQGQGEVAAQIINGAPLRYNWDNSDTAEGVDARAVLPEGEVTHLILTEALPLANHVKWSETDVYAQAFYGLAVSANPDAQVYLQETWHSLRSGTGEPVEHDDGAGTPWRARLDADLPVWESIAQSVSAGRRDGAAPVRIIPAGQGMALLHDRIAAGAVEGIDNIARLFDDDIHLSDLGHYFVAMVQYATLTGESPLGLPAEFTDRYGKAFDAPDADLARTLQGIAWEAVETYRARTPEQQARAATVQEPAAPPPATGPPGAETEAAAPVSADPTPPGEFTPVPGRSDMAIGLAPVSDWATQQPFLDVMKLARPWIGHFPGKWGGMSYEDLQATGFLDPDGWPLRMPPIVGSIGTLILTDLPADAEGLSGRYRLRFDGRGIVEVAGRATNVRYGKNEVTFEFTPGPGGVDIRLQRIFPADPLRNITVVRQDYAARFDAGEVFHPLWLDLIAEFDALRFMDWMATNNSDQHEWKDRPRAEDVTYARKGVPVELLVRLSNEVGTDGWFTLPHRADDTYIRNFARYVSENLDPALKVYVEYSNEVWNTRFEQAAWVAAQAEALWGDAGAAAQYHGMRAAEVAGIWSDVFADADAARLVNVVATHTGWLGYEKPLLDAPLAQKMGKAAPAEAFDAYAVTGYFGGVLGKADRREVVQDWLDESLARAEAGAAALDLTGQAARDHVQAHRFDHATTLAARELRDGALGGDPVDTLADLALRVWPYHAAVAQAHDLDLVMYEGGSHVVGLGPLVDDAELTAFFHHLNYSAEMGALYSTLLENWRAVGGQLFNAYVDVFAPVKWGSWGARRHLGDENPRWEALVEFE